MPDGSYVDMKYFIDDEVYNCPDCYSLHENSALLNLRFRWIQTQVFAPAVLAINHLRTRLRRIHCNLRESRCPSDKLTSSRTFVSLSELPPIIKKTARTLRLDYGTLALSS